MREGRALFLYPIQLGMVRSSIDSAGGSPAQRDKQFTPSVRQFSAPKAVKDSEYEYLIFLSLLLIKFLI